MSTHAAPIKSRHDPRRPSPSPAVEVSRLRKEFKRSDRRSRVGKKRRVVALHELTFSIERGECVALPGQNGSGKSTLVPSCQPSCSVMVARHESSATMSSRSHGRYGAW